MRGTWRVVRHEESPLQVSGLCLLPLGTPRKITVRADGSIGTTVCLLFFELVHIDCSSMLETVTSHPMFISNAKKG